VEKNPFEQYYAIVNSLSPNISHLAFSLSDWVTSFVSIESVQFLQTNPWSTGLLHPNSLNAQMQDQKSSIASKLQETCSQL
jgi:hypothetical protein